MTPTAPAVANPIAADFIARITACWNRTRADVIEMGRLLLEAKHALPHGAFGEMVRAELPFGERYAQHFMAIARDPRLTNPKHASLLPASAETLYELTKLDAATFSERLSGGAIAPDMKRTDAIALVKEARLAPARAGYAARVAQGCDVSDLEALVASGYQAGAIVADAPWRFETWSAKGRDRAPAYRTDPLKLLAELPVAKLAAKNCVLFLWVIGPMLREGLDLIDAWGFDLKTIGFVWMKQNPSGEGLFLGPGYWTRANAELCLLATRGAPSRLDAGVAQALLAPLQEHSRKPDEIHARIERLVGGPYLELYARRPRAGWTTWGNEIARADFAEMAATPEPAGLAEAATAPAWRAEAVRMRAAGARLFDIAAALGRSPSTVHTALNEKGDALIKRNARAKRYRRGVGRGVGGPSPGAGGEVQR